MLHIYQNLAKPLYTSVKIINGNIYAAAHKDRKLQKLFSH